MSPQVSGFRLYTLGVELSRKPRLGKLLRADPLPTDLHGEIEQEILEITAVVRRPVRDEMSDLLQGHMNKAIRQGILSCRQVAGPGRNRQILPQLSPRA